MCATLLDPSTDERLRLYHNPDHSRLCGRGALVGLRADARALRFVPMLCKRWSCPRCAPLRKAHWRRRIQAGKPTRWLTLTHCYEHGQPLSEMIDRMEADWQLLVKRIRRRFKIFSYVRVMELTALGVPHFHVVYTGTFLPQKWLSRNWTELHGAPVVWIGYLNQSSQASRYVSKYLNKSAADIADRAPRARVVTCSRDWPQEPALPAGSTTEEPYVWRRVKTEPASALPAILSSPLRVTAVSTSTWAITVEGEPEQIHAAWNRLTSGAMLSRIGTSLKKAVKTARRAQTQEALNF